MAGSDEVVACTRNAQCRCPDCAAASAAFSVSELRAFSSSINYEDPLSNSIGHSQTDQKGISSSSSSATAKTSNNSSGKQSPPASAMFTQSSSPPPSAPVGKKEKAPLPAKPWLKKKAVAKENVATAPQVDQAGGEEQERMEVKAAVNAGVGGRPMMQKKQSSQQQQGQEEIVRKDEQEQEAAMVMPRRPSALSPPIPTTIPDRPEDPEGLNRPITPLPVWPVPKEEGAGGEAQAAAAEDESPALVVNVQEVDQETLPARLTEKNWKVRREAYIQLHALLLAAASGAGGVDDFIFESYGPLMSKIVDDSNASALDAGLDVALVYIDRAPVPSAVGLSFAEAIVPKIINRALPGRPSTLKKGQAILIKLMEVDTPEVTVIALLEGLTDKRPKVPPACLAAVEEGLRAFGPRHFPFKVLKTKLKPLFESSNKAVRQAALELVVESCRWTGVGHLKDIISELRPAQQKEINEATADIQLGQSQPTIGLRKYRGQDQSSGKSGGAGGPGGSSSRSNVGGGKEVAGEGGDAGYVFDPYELADPVDLLAKLSSSDFYSKLGESKWSEKVEALQFAIKTVGDIPKLVPGDYGELIRSLKQLIGHSHIQVATGSVRLLGLLASGLRERFSPWAPSIWGLIAAKAKDKKALGAATEALDMMYGKALSFESALEEIDAALDSKKGGNVPHTRVMVLEWLDRSLPLSSTTASSNGSSKTELNQTTKITLAKLCLRSLEDNDPKVREAAQKATARLLEVTNKESKDYKALLIILEALKQSNRKVYDRIVNGEVPEGDGQRSRAASRASSKTPTEMLKGGAESANGPSSRPPSRSSSRGASAASAASLGHRRVGSGTSKAVTAAKAEGRKTPTGRAATPPAQEEQVDESSASIDPDEASERLSTALKVDGWENDILPKLKGAKWQDRKDALQVIRQAISASSIETTAGTPGLLASLITFLGEHSKKFKESNVNVIREVFETAVAGLQFLVSEKPTMSDKAAAVIMIPIAVEKLIDKKLKDLSCALLTASAEIVGPAPVVKRVAKGVLASKAPAVHAEAMTWLGSCCVAEFGAGRAGIQALASFAVEEAGNSNQTIRKAAIELLGVIYQQVGPPLRSLALPESIKPAIKSSVEAEFEKVGFDPSLAAKLGHNRRVKGEEGAAGAGGGGSSGGGLGLPRFDLGSMEKDLLSRMGSTDGKKAWEVRKAAIEEVIAACERSGHYVEANKSAVEVLKALRIRLNDTQANLKPLAAQAIADVVVSLDEQIAPKYVKLIAELLLGGAADNKKVMRDASLAALDRIFGKSRNGAIIEAILAPLASALMHAVGRTELLNTLVKSFPQVTCEASVLAGPLLDALQDKTATARAAAEACLIPLLRSGALRQQTLQNGMRDFAPAVKRSLAIPLQRVQEGAAASASAPPSTTTTTATTNEKTADHPPPLPPPPSSKPSNNQEAERPTSIKATRAPTPEAAEVVVPSPAPAPAPTNHGLGSASSTVAAAAAVSHSNSTDPMGESISSAQSENGVSFLKRNVGKNKREEEFRRMRWVVPPEEPRAEDMEALRNTWSPLLSSGEGGALDRLFPPTGRKGTLDTSIYLGGVDVLSQALDDSFPAYVDHLDLIFRWLALRLCDKENVQVLQRVLELLVRTLEALKADAYSLRDFEANIVIPHVLEKSGNAKERFRKMFREIMRLFCDVYPFSKYGPMLINALSSKNLRARSTCLDEIRRVMDYGGSPTLILGKKGLREVGKYLEAREPEVRSAALEVMLSAYEKLGKDMNRLSKAAEGGLSDKARNLIEEKARDRNRSGSLTSSIGGSGTCSSGGGGVANQAERGLSACTGLRAPSDSIDRSLGGSNGGVNTAIRPGHRNSASGQSASKSPGGALVHGRRSSDGTNLDLRLQPSAAIVGTGSQQQLQQQQAYRMQRASVSSSPDLNLKGTPNGGQGLPQNDLFQFHSEDITYGSPENSPRSSDDGAGGGRGRNRRSSGAARALRFDGAGSIRDISGGGLNSKGLAERLPAFVQIMDSLSAFLALSDPVPQTSKEYIEVMKALTAISIPSQRDRSGELNHAEQSKLVLEEEALRMHGDKVINRVVECLVKAFRCSHSGVESLQGIDAVLVEACVKALNQLYRCPPVCLQVTPELLSKTLEEGLWLSGDGRLATAAAAEASVAAAGGASKGPATSIIAAMKKTASEILKNLAPHVCWAALLDTMTRQRKRRVDARASEAAVAVAAFSKVYRTEKMALSPLEKVDVSKVIGPLDTFFGRGPEEEAAVARYKDAEAQVSLLLEGLVTKLGANKFRLHLQMAGLEKGSSGLYRRFSTLISKMDGDAQGGAHLDADGRIPEVVDLITKVLDIHSDPEYMKRLYNVLKAQGRPLAEQLKLYDLSDQSFSHLVSRLHALEQGALLDSLASPTSPSSVPLASTQRTTRPLTPSRGDPPAYSRLRATTASVSGSTLGGNEGGGGNGGMMMLPATSSQPTIQERIKQLKETLLISTTNNTASGSAASAASLTASSGGGQGLASTLVSNANSSSNLTGGLSGITSRVASPAMLSSTATALRSQSLPRNESEQLASIKDRLAPVLSEQSVAVHPPSSSIEPAAPRGSSSRLASAPGGIAPSTSLDQRPLEVGEDLRSRFLQVKKQQHQKPPPPPPPPRLVQQQQGGREEADQPILLRHESSGGRGASSPALSPPKSILPGPPPRPLTPSATPSFSQQQQQGASLAGQGLQPHPPSEPRPNTASPRLRPPPPASRPPGYQSPPPS